MLNGNLTADVDNRNAGSLPSSVQFTMLLTGSTFTINGDTHIVAVSESTASAASYTIFTVSNSTLNLNGNVYINNTVEKYQGASGGTNGIYAVDYGVINITGDSCDIITYGYRPDSISAKNGGIVNLNANDLRVVGSVDFNRNNTHGGVLNAVFDGTSSYWYGDLLEQLNTAYSPGTLNITFKNGAEYIPFGTLSENQHGAKKYLSSIEFGNGGIVNLYDSYAKDRWVDLGLDIAYPDLMTTDLDYILIGDLKGSNGIFRLDMNDQDKANTDIVYILDSTSGEGLNNIEAYNENQYRNVSATNTLRFATVAAAAADKLVFKDSMNLKGEYLWDYQLLIGNSPYDLADSENAIYNGSRDGLTAAQIDAMMVGGTNWFIYGYNETPSQNAITILDSADFGYDMATRLDRYHNRHTQAKFITEDSAIWVRMQRSKMGRDSGYTGYSNLMQIGYEGSKNENNRYGIAYEYEKGKADFSASIGKNEDSRKGVMIYNTRTKDDGAYLDLVARYGRLNSEVNAYNTDRGTYINGDSKANVWTVGAEVGKKMKKEDGKTFFEPQLQLQYARVGGSDYSIGNGINASVSSANSFIGRLGFRLGNDINKDSSVYLKADILREFAGGQDVNLTASNGTTMGSKVNKRGTWYDVGVGADLRLSKGVYLTLDAARNFGGNLSNSWDLNAAMYFAFGGPKKVAPLPVAAVIPVTASKHEEFLDTIYFDFDIDTPRAGEQAKIDNFVKVAKENPDRTYSMVGHTDAIGTDEYNMDLSKRRVENVKSIAKNAGVPAEQMEESYQGKAEPADTDATAEGRANNRRVNIFEYK